MTVKRVVAYHIARLKDKSPDVRLKAIKELELLGDPESLPALQEVFIKDDNADVRKAAQDAGRSIFANNKSR